MSVPYPDYIAKALAECTADKPAFTHQIHQVPMDSLAELPLGIVTSNGRHGGFGLTPPSQEALRLMRTAMASMPEARKKPGVRMAAMAACLVHELGGDRMPSKIADRATRFAGLTIGDAYTLIFMLQSKRQGGVVEMEPMDCYKCGEEFVPRLRLDDRPVNVFRKQLGTDDDPKWGGMLAADEAPHVVVPLKSAIQLGGNEVRKLVMRSPTWSAACYGVPKVAWQDEDSTALYESIVQAAIVGTEHGPCPPVTNNAWRKSGLMAYDFDDLKVAVVAVSGGPPGLITIDCPNKGNPETGAVGCEAKMAFPVGWEVADDFFALG